MDFSEIFPGATITLFSPNSQFVILSNGVRVIIKDLKTLQSLQFTHSQFSDATIGQIDISPDSSLIALSFPKRGYVEIRKMPNEDPNWVARIDDNGGGVESIRWAPDSIQLLLFSEFQIKLSIYNLATKAINYIKSPKSEKSTSFSKCGKFMALAERKEAKDYMGIYSTKEWKLLNYMQVDTLDLVSLEWSSNDAFVAVWDSEVNYKLLVYCPCQGLQMKFEPYTHALGIKQVAFANQSEMVAVGSYDEKIRLLNLVTLRLITELEHKPSFSQYRDLIVYKEEEFKDTFIGQKTVTKYANVDPSSLKIPQLKNAQSTQGIGLLQWSHDDAYIASRNDNMPNILWIWEVQSLELKCILIQLGAIKHFQWCQNAQILVLCTGQNKIYFWSPTSTSACDMPYEGRAFNVQKIDWSLDQKCLLLQEKGDVVVAYPQIDILNPGSSQYMEEDDINNQF